MPSFAVNDGTQATINYEVVKNLVPETTLFIHGNLASNRWWYPAQEFWQVHAKDQNYQGSLIYAEFRGCGQSSAPRHDSEVDMHVFANDFVSMVRDLNLGPINLVGHSTGGLIAALMLAKAPELFKKAILLDPVSAQGVKFDHNMIGAFEQMKVNKDLVGLVLGSTIYQNNPASAYFKTVVVEDAFHAVKSVGHLVLKALDGLDSRHEVAKIPHSVLVLHGEHDTLLERNESEKLAALIKNAQFKVIDGQGHCTNVEAPEKFVRLVKDFLFQ
jgi:pimeloyl-ACP methyl ester carboxylesterase